MGMRFFQKEGRAALSYLRCCRLPHNFPSSTSRPYTVQGKRQEICSCHSMFCRSQTSRCSTCFAGRDRDWQAFWTVEGFLRAELWVKWTSSATIKTIPKIRTFISRGWWLKDQERVWVSQTRNVFIFKSLNVREKPELLWRRNATPVSWNGGQA